MKYLFKNNSMLSNNSGIALPLVLMVMLVLILFGTAAYTASQSSLKQSVRLDPTLQCKYLARSAVDATKEAWKAQYLIDPSSVSTVAVDTTFYTKYDEANNEFESVTSPSEYDDDYVIKTIQKYAPATGICTITSSVKIGNHSATVKARSEKVTDTAVTGDAATDKWYEYKTYKISGFTNWSRWTILPGPDEKIVDDSDGTKYHATYHATEGKVNFNTNAANTDVLYSNGTLLEDIDRIPGLIGKYVSVASWLVAKSPLAFLNQSNFYFHYNVTGLQAKQIVFHCPVDLYHNTSLPLSELIKIVENPHSLILSAETIEFKKLLTIGDSAYGNLTLRLPPGAGIPGNVVYKRVADANTARTSDIDLDIIDLDARYGVVKFGTVVFAPINITTGKNDVALISNQTFFFRVMDENDPKKKALNIGTEPNTFSRLAEILNVTKTENDCQFQTLIDRGYLIPATQDDYTEISDILFIYE